MSQLPIKYPVHIKCSVLINVCCRNCLTHTHTEHTLLPQPPDHEIPVMQWAHVPRPTRLQHPVCTTACKWGGAQHLSKQPGVASWRRWCQCWGLGRYQGSRYMGGPEHLLGQGRKTIWRVPGPRRLCLH